MRRRNTLPLLRSWSLSTNRWDGEAVEGEERILEGEMNEMSAGPGNEYHAMIRDE
jgi:hypothetical protein